MIWSSASPRPLGQPVALGKDQVVLYVSIDTIPYVQVMDARTGKVRWRQAVAFGAVNSGVPVVPAVVGGKVVYLRPEDDSMGSGRIVIAEPLTGKDISVAKDALWITERPYECGTQVCFSGKSPDDKAQQFKVEVPSGRTTVDQSRLLPGATEIGLDDLQTVHINGRPDLLIRRTAGRTLWQRSFADLFGAGHDIGNASRFREIGTSGVVVAQINWTGHKESFVEDLAKDRRVVAFDVKTGRTLWSQTGTDQTCLPTGNHAGGADPLAVLRCRWAAGSVLTTNGTQETITKGAVSLEAFEPKSGRTLWSVPMGSPVGQEWDTWTGTFAVAGQRTLVVNGAAGRKAVDASNGKVSDPPPGLQGVCQQWVTGPIWNGGWTDDGVSRNIYYTGTAYRICDLKGGTVVADQAWPSRAGLDIAGMHVVTTPEGILGTRMMPGPDPKPTVIAPAAAPGPTTPRMPSPTGPPVLAWTSEAAADRVLTQPVVAGRIALVYARHDQVLNLEGLEPATGRVLWRQPASAGTFGLFDAISPTVVGDRVLYPRSAPGRTDDSVVMVVADAATGRDLHVFAGPYALRDWPRQCGAQACFTVYNSNGMYAMRAQLASGFIAQDPPLVGAAQTPIGAGLVKVTTGSAKVTIAALDTNTLRFQIPAESVVPAGYTTYRGAFSFWPASGVYVGEFPQDLSSVTPTSTAIGAKAPMVGLDARTGKKLWATTGTDTTCLPWTFRSNPRYPVRCRWSANATEVYRDGTWTYQNADLSMEGFDPRTGSTTWSVSLARRTGEVTDSAAAAGDHAVITSGRGGLIMVDLQTGRTLPVGSSQVRYCSTGITSSLGLTRNINGAVQPDQWTTGTAWQQCNSAKVPVAPTAAWPSWIGAQVGGIRIVLTGTGLQGYRQR